MLAAELKGQSAAANFNLEIVDCEYRCSSILNYFNPDYFFVDCLMGDAVISRICRHLAEDARVPFVRIVLVGNMQKIPSGCERNIFARMDLPLSVERMAGFVADVGAAAPVTEKTDG